MKYVKSQSAFKEAQDHIPGGVNSPVRSFKNVGGTPPFIKSGKGSKITDIDGNSYIDYVLSYGPLILGHAAGNVTNAVKKAAENGTSFGAPTVAETKLAKMITEIVHSMEMVRFVNSGTEATMSALRLARAFTRRDLIVKFTGCYHGHHDSLLVKAGSGAATLGIPDSPGVPRSATATTITIPFNDINAVKTLFKNQGWKIAAVIMEPTPGNMGLVLPKDGYLETVHALTEKYGALLIFDEVMSGFRSSLGGSQELYAITPDITCLGKVIGGGLPVAAYGGRGDIMEMVAPSGPMYQAGTLSGNPLAMAAGIAALTKVVQGNVCAKLESMTAILAWELEKAAKKAGVPVKVHRLGSMFTVFFSEKPVTDWESAAACNQDAFRAYFHSMLEQGIYLPPSQFETNFLSASHTPADIKKTVKAAETAFKNAALQM